MLTKHRNVIPALLSESRMLEAVKAQAARLYTFRVVTACLNG
jgi:hypothetical protein